MRKVAENILGAVFLAVRRIGKSVKNDLTKDIHDGRQWITENVPRTTKIAVEKWLGFWYALFLTAVFGLIGTGIVESARWSSGVPLIADTVPGIITYAGIFGFLLTLNAGLVMFGVLTVTAARMLLWLRNSVKNIWKCHTPPYEGVASESRVPLQPISKEDRSKARDNALSFGLWGSIWFMLTTSILLFLEQNYSNLLYGATSNPQLESAGKVLDTAFWVVDLESLFIMFVPSTTQTEIVLFILILVIPGIWFVFASRNLLFVTETGVRKQIKEVQDANQIGWTALGLAGALTYFTLTAVIAAYRLLSGV